MAYADPSLPVIFFDPSSVHIDENNNAVFTVYLAEAADTDITVEYKTVSGTALGDTDFNGIVSYSPLTFEAGDLTQTITINTYGDTLLEPDESFFLELFNPVGATFGQQNHSLRATGWILDDDAGGGQTAVAVAAPAVAEEDGGVATFTITLSEAFSEDTTLSYATVAGSALAGKDFEAISGTVTFEAGDLEQTVEVDLLDDALTEATETFGLKVSGVGLSAFGQAEIVDDDSKLPILSVEGGQIEENGNVVFTIRLSKPSTSEVTVHYKTSAGTATEDTDYNGTVSYNPLTFDVGETVKTISIDTYGDTDSEPDENFFLELLNPVGASFGPGDAAPKAAAWILDDDPGGVKRALTVSGVTVAEAAEGQAGKATFTIHISEALDEDVTLSYATQDGTAKAGSDYVKKTGTVTIAAGATEAQVTVNLVNSTLAESTESFSLKLSGIPADDFATDAGAVTKTATAKISDATIKGTSGSDTLTGTSAGDRIEAFAGLDKVYGKDGNDRLYGGNSDDRIYGGADKDRAYGGSGDDRAYGGADADHLYGGSGDDNLYGGDGNDRLYGGTGIDRLYGGEGDDTFVFTSLSAAGTGTGRDRIYDFDRDDDVIDVSGIDANSGKKGNQTFDFIGSKSFSGTAGELRFTNERVSGDVDGDKKADFSITVADISKLGASDFLL